jgi:hypothetical protein
VKVGDLVLSKSNPDLGMGIITSCEDSTKRYVWVRFAKWRENDKWCSIDHLEVISESR